MNWTSCSICSQCLCRFHIPKCIHRYCSMSITILCTPCVSVRPCGMVYGLWTSIAPYSYRHFFLLFFFCFVSFRFVFWFNNINDAHSNLNTLFLLEVILHSNKQIAIFPCLLLFSFAVKCALSLLYENSVRLAFKFVAIPMILRNVTSSENWMNGNLSIYVFTLFYGKLKIGFTWLQRQMTGKPLLPRKWLSPIPNATSNQEKRKHIRKLRT